MQPKSSVYAHLESIDFSQYETTPGLYLDSWERVHEAIEREADIKQKALLASIQKFFHDEITNPEKRQRIALHEIASSKGWPENYPQEFKERITHLCEEVIHQDAEHRELVKVITVCRASLNELFHPEITLTSNVNMSVKVRRCTLLEGEYFAGVFSMENEKTDFELDCSDTVLERLHHYLETGTIEVEVLQDPEALKELLEKAHFWMMPQLYQLCWQGLLKFKEKHVGYILWAHRHYEKDFLNALIQQQPKDALCFFTSPKPGELLVEIPTWKGSAYTLEEFAKAVTEVVEPQALKQIIAEARDLLALLFEPDSTLCTEKGEAITLWRGFLHEGEGILEFLTPKDEILFKHSYAALKGLKSYLETGKVGEEIAQNRSAMEELLTTALEWRIPRLTVKCIQELMKWPDKELFYLLYLRHAKDFNVLLERFNKKYPGFTLSYTLGRVSLTLSQWEENYLPLLSQCRHLLEEILFRDDEAFLLFFKNCTPPFEKVTTLDLSQLSLHLPPDRVVHFFPNVDTKRYQPGINIAFPLFLNRLTVACPHLKLLCIPPAPWTHIEEKQWLEQFPHLRVTINGKPLPHDAASKKGEAIASSDEELYHIILHSKDEVVSLSLVSDQVTDPLLREVALRCPSIKSLTLDSLSGVTPEGLGHLVKLAPNLRALAFRSMDQLTDELLMQFLDNAKDLSELELHSCKALHEESLKRALASKTTSLQVIECPNIEGNTLFEMNPSTPTQQTPLSLISSIASLEFRSCSPLSYEQCLELLKIKHTGELITDHCKATSHALILRNGRMSHLQELCDLIELNSFLKIKKISTLHFERMTIEGDYTDLPSRKHPLFPESIGLRLWYLSFAHGELNPSLFTSLINMSPTLLSLSLRHCTGLDPETLLQMQQEGKLSGLTALCINGWSALTPKILFPLIENTKIHALEYDCFDEDGVETLVNTRSDVMRTLAMYRCDQLSKNAFRRIGNFKRLETLILSDALELDDDTLIALFSELPYLHRLKLISCPKITDRALELLGPRTKSKKYCLHLTLEKTGVTAAGIRSLQLCSTQTKIDAR